MLRRLHSLLCLACLLCATTNASATVVGDATLPDTWALENQTLVLNGAGLREYGFLRIAVYAGALYLPARETDAAKILRGTAPKVIHMKMLRRVSREDSVEAWTHYLKANCTAQSISACDKESPAFKAALTAFQSATPETNVDDTQTFIFRDGQATWLRNGKPVATFRDAAFTRALLACWIGDVPTTTALKAALLGGAR
jgi:hypothetical protein